MKIEVTPLSSEQCNKMGKNHPYFKILNEILKEEWTPKTLDAYRAIHGRAGLLPKLVKKARKRAGLQIE